MLEQFEFENKRDGTEAEITANCLDDGRPANVRPDDFFRRSDLVAIDSYIRHWRQGVVDICAGGKRQGATTSFSLGFTWTAARLEASQPPPSALTKRTLVTSRWP